MCATGVNGANQMRPETNNAYRIARIPAMNELFQRVRSVIARSIVWWWMGGEIFMSGSAVRGESRLGPAQPLFHGIIIKQFRVAAPLDGGIELALRFCSGKMFVEQIMEQFRWNAAIGFRTQSRSDLLKQRHMREQRFSKQLLALLNISGREFPAEFRNDCVAMIDA